MIGRIIVHTEAYILSADVHVLNRFFDYAKSRYFRSFNAILSKVGTFASEEVVISLIYAKCLPVLLYSTEACRILVRDKRSVEFTVRPTRSLMKLLRTSSANIVLIDIHNARFLEDFIINNNMLSCRRETALQGTLLLTESGRLELGHNILLTLYVCLQPL